MADIDDNAPSTTPDTSEPGISEPAAEDHKVYGPGDDEQVATLDTRGFAMINIRNLSVKCGHCNTYQTLCTFEPGGDWNVYTYECENDICDPEKSRTVLEVPTDLDEFARRDPNWRGGKIHAGAHG